jgi:hypothetical protein
MAKFMFILSSPPNPLEQLTPDERQRVAEKFTAWGARIAQSGKKAGGNKLLDEGGKTVTRKRGKLRVVDGPYSETKEVVGGYLVVNAESYEEAVGLLRDCPQLDFYRIEVRKVDPMGCSGE